VSILVPIAAFGAALGGANSVSGGQQRGNAHVTAMMHKPLSQMPPARDTPTGESARAAKVEKLVLNVSVGGDTRGSNTSASRSEMKRINALNLEPAMPRIDDTTPRRRAAPKGLRTHDQLFDRSLGRAGSAGGGNSGGGGGGGGGNAGGGTFDDQSQQHAQQQSQQQAQGQQRGQQDGTPSQGYPNARNTRSGGAGGGADAGSKSKTGLNPQAQEFSLNTQAAAFTPTGTGNAQQQQAPMLPPTKPASPRAPAIPFSFFPNSDLVNKKLSCILDKCFERVKRERLDVSEAWQEATGPSYHQILGLPNLQMGGPPGAGPLQGGMVPMGGPWQPPPNQGGGQMGGCSGGPPGGGQSGGGGGGGPNNGVQQGGPVGGPQMGGMCTGPQGMMGPGMQQGMPQGFMMVNAPGGQPQGMYQPMYFMPQGPGGPQQQMPNGAGGQQGMQGGFVVANMPGGQGPQGQQPVAFFNPQMMMVPAAQQGGPVGSGGQDGWNQNNSMGGQMANPNFGGPMQQQKGGGV